MFVSAVIVAAGSGSRLNSQIPKQFLALNGKEILAHTVEKFEKCEIINEIIIVTNHVDYCLENIVRKHGFGKVVKVAEGGAERQASVFNGLTQLSPLSDVVLVHDGVRPFVSCENIHAVVSCAQEKECAVLGVRVKDTIKECNDKNIAVDTPDRSKLWAVQTPQGFKTSLLLRAHEQAAADGFLGTDDAMLLERMGVSVYMVQGSYENIKITTASDLLYGEWYAARNGDLE